MNNKTILEIMDESFKVYLAKSEGHNFFKKTNPPQLVEVVEMAMKDSFFEGVSIGAKLASNQL